MNDNNSTTNQSASSLVIPVPECQVILDDIFSSSQTEKSKVLKASLEKNHSASSHQLVDKSYLESLLKRDPIAWPSMNDAEKWSQLDDEVSLLLVGASTIQERVALLETSIYNKAAQLFGHLPPPKKGLRGLNRRAQHSIKLVIEKNKLLAQIDSCPDEAIKTSLHNLLLNVHQQLRNYRRGEKKQETTLESKTGVPVFFKEPIPGW